MDALTESQALRTDDMTSLIAGRIGLARNQMFPYTDRTDFMNGLLKGLYRPSSRLISAGQTTPDIAIAADRAEIDLAEIIPDSPFAASTEKPLAEISRESDIIYVSNPNRVTGANYSLKEIELMARAVPQGALIVDEQFYDFFGITAIPLLKSYANVVVLRSFAASFGIYSSDAGYAVADVGMVALMKDSIGQKTVSLMARKMILATLTNDQILADHLKQVREESLRVSTTLNRFGVQSRITATDFLLLRVASPKDVGNFLAGCKVTVENLDGYPQMKNYLRYRLESPLSNDKLISAFEKMPPETFRMKGHDRRKVTLSQSGQSESPATGDDPVEQMLLKKTKQRKTTATIREQV